MDSEEVARFMANFARLKSCVDHDPSELVNDAIRDESVRDLCDRLSWDAFELESAEKRNPALSTAPVNPDFIAAWREYEKWYKPAVSWVSANVFFVNAGLTDAPIEEELSKGPRLKTKPIEDWQDADAAAARTVKEIQTAINFAEGQISNEDVWEDHPDLVEDVQNGVAAWLDLTARHGIDLRGILRRRALVPFLLVPRKISNQQGSTERTALMLNIQEAQQAFVNGTLSASVTLLRATVEVVLKEHYRAFGKDLEERISGMRGKLPPGVTVRELHELRELANRFLHDVKRVSDDRLDAGEPEAELKVVRMLVLVRSLIEAVK